MQNQQILYILGALVLGYVIAKAMTKGKEDTSTTTTPPVKQSGRLSAPQSRTSSPYSSAPIEQVFRQTVRDERGESQVQYRRA